MISNSRRAPVYASLLCALLLFPGLLQGQGLNALLGNSKGPAPAAAASSSDPFGRETPRNAIRNFLESCHSRKYDRASQYLDLRKLGKSRRLTEGPRMAEELCTLLDRNQRFELERLDNTAEGKRDDALATDIDLLQTFDLNDQPVPLYLQREKDEGADVWVVSADSVLRVPELSQLAQGPAIEKKLPAPLVNIRFIGTPLWIWIALVLLAMLLSALSRVLSRLALWALRPVAGRFFKSASLSRLETFTEPVRLLISVLVFRFCMGLIAPSALLRDYLIKMLALLAVFGAAAFIMRFVDLASDHVTSRLDTRQRALSYSVLPLFVRVVKICIFCFAVLVVLSQWGYNTGTILAGLGVGGLAVALAAQKTIENLFGGVAVISDRPVLVGDFCQFGGQVGTVEDIGLRSTRIRTLDRTLVTIPNAVFSTMTLENYSRRDRMWFHPTLSLRRGTSPAEIRQFMEAVTNVLTSHPMVDPTAVPLRFTKISKESFDLEVFAYVKTSSSDEFLPVQTELLLRIVEAASALNIVFAVPVIENVITTGSEESERNFRVLLTDNAETTPAEEQPALGGKR
ncbi:MAG: putative mechanosensitive ion channel protein [Bryobacterales bacterium]|nr:putative mechanosensitive ion channel protein [Bryobacterales bacterium]